MCFSLKIKYRNIETKEFPIQLLNIVVNVREGIRTVLVKHPDNLSAPILEGVAIESDSTDRLMLIVGILKKNVNTLKCLTLTIHIFRLYFYLLTTAPANFALSTNVAIQNLLLANTILKIELLMTTLLIYIQHQYLLYEHICNKI